MIDVKEINKEQITLCVDVDLGSINFWSETQWKSEFSKKGTKVFGLFWQQEIVAVTAIQIVIDEAQINYFSVIDRFQRNGFGSYLMFYLIRKSDELKVKKFFLEVSVINSAAINFYAKFNFETVGRRKKYYKDGSDALLKEKNLIKK